MKHAIALALLAICCSAAAAEAQLLESGLRHALQLKKGTLERTGTSGQAIRAYMQIRRKVARAHYASLSCRERDAEREP